MKNKEIIKRKGVVENDENNNEFNSSLQRLFS